MRDHVTAARGRLALMQAQGEDVQALVVMPLAGQVLTLRARRARRMWNLGDWDGPDTVTRVAGVLVVADGTRAIYGTLYVTFGGALLLEHR